MIYAPGCVRPIYTYTLYQQLLKATNKGVVFHPHKHSSQFGGELKTFIKHKVS